MKFLSRKLFLLPLLTLALGFASANAHAAKFGVRVVGADGLPVAGAAVCVGTHGDYKQFGAFFTSSEGDVIVDVPPVPLVVTVSKSRFSGVRLDEPARRFNLIKTVKLHDGVPGPRCRAGSSLADSGSNNSGASSSDLQIAGVSVNDSAFNVAVVPSITGIANSYRMSRSQSMDNAKWRNLSSRSITVDPNLLGSTVYLQVRRFKQVEGATLEAHSNIVPVNLAGF